MSPRLPPTQDQVQPPMLPGLPPVGEHMAEQMPCQQRRIRRLRELLNQSHSRKPPSERTLEERVTNSRTSRNSERMRYVSRTRALQ